MYEPRGNYHDIVVTESFEPALKGEYAYQQFSTNAEVRLAFFEYN